jgi:hypothetical protein
VLADEAGCFFLQDEERWSFWHGGSSLQASLSLQGRGRLCED